VSLDIPEGVLAAGKGEKGGREIAKVVGRDGFDQHFILPKLSALSRLSDAL
jgi:hypothetical protein